MKHGLYISMVLMALLSLPKSGYAMIPSFALLNDTTRQIAIYFDEDVAYNIDLSIRRNNSTRVFLQCRYPLVCFENIELISIGEDWNGFREMVEKDLNLPDREEVLMLIDYHRDDVVKRKQLFGKLNRGISYQYIVRNVLPKLRRSLITIVRGDSDAEIKTLEPASSTSELFVSEQEEALPDYQPNRADVLIDKKQSYEVATSEVEEPVQSETILAIKNNLLYNLALAPNVEIEVPLGKRWSLNTELKCPWWLNNRNNFCYQLLSGGMEGRCWLGNRQERNRLTGHFVGLYAEGGIYDFQFGEDGCQGKYYGRIYKIYSLRGGYCENKKWTLSLYRSYQSEDFISMAHNN